MYFLSKKPSSNSSKTYLICRIARAFATFLFLGMGIQSCSALTSVAPVDCDLRKDLSASLQSNPDLSWSQIYQTCQAEIKSYQRSDEIGYTWFANTANGIAGKSLVILKSLPALAPEIWGPATENFSKFGLFSGPDSPDRVLPRGLGVASPDGRPADENNNPIREIDYSKPGLYVTTFSCGSCQSGRVKTDQGCQVLEGAPNTQFDVRLWRQAFLIHEQNTLIRNRLECSGIHLGMNG